MYEAYNFSKLQNVKTKVGVTKTQCHLTVVILSNMVISVQGESKKVHTFYWGPISW